MSPTGIVFPWCSIGWSAVSDNPLFAPYTPNVKRVPTLVATSCAGGCNKLLAVPGDAGEEPPLAKAFSGAAETRAIAGSQEYNFRKRAWRSRPLFCRIEST
jgi:hypothetical protein